MHTRTSSLVGGRRRLAVIVLAAGVAAAAVPTALGLLRSERRDDIKISTNERVASIATSWGQTARMWMSTTTDGGRCTFVELVDRQASAQMDIARAGGNCSRDEQTLPIQATITRIRLDSGSYGVLLDGSVSSASGITTLSLADGEGGAAPLPLSQRRYLMELPPVQSTVLKLPGSPTLIGKNASDAEVARLDLNKLLSDATPK